MEDGPTERVMSMITAHKAGATFKAIGATHGISGARVSQIISRHHRAQCAKEIRQRRQEEEKLALQAWRAELQQLPDATPGAPIINKLNDFDYGYSLTKRLVELAVPKEIRDRSWFNPPIDGITLGDLRRISDQRFGEDDWRLALFRHLIDAPPPQDMVDELTGLVAKAEARVAMLERQLGSADARLTSLQTSLAVAKRKMNHSR